MAAKRKVADTPNKQPPVAGSSGNSADSLAPTAGDSGLASIALLTLVFVAGGVLMSLEIAGSRVLAPHFGNSVFVWGSLISVFLIALSLGYFVGGRVADRYPSPLLLSTVCVLSGFAILLIAFVADGVAKWLTGVGLGEHSGPFVASVILFLPPSIGLGVVSPFAVRLGTSSVQSAGRSAGTLYAFSTLGSIAGTLLTTFVLVPTVGLSTIIKGLAATLIVCAVGTMPGLRRREIQTAAVALGVLVGVCLFQPVSRAERQPGEKVLADLDTAYHHITVMEKGAVRQLRFDDYVETVIATTPPYPSLAPYTNYFHLAFLAMPEIDSAAFIGAGGGVGPRTFHTHTPSMQIDVVDIDAEILRLAEEYFFLEPCPEIRPVAADGRMFLAATEEIYDCIILDAFTIGGRIPFHLVTQEFLQLCVRKMDTRSVFVMNINSAVEGPQSEIFHAMYRTLDSVFDQTYAFSVQGKGRPRTESRNIILVATCGMEAMSASEWDTRAREYTSASSVDQAWMQTAAGDLIVEIPEMGNVPVFTDDYAPIETMSF